MKKTISVILSVILVCCTVTVCLTGCSSEEDEVSSTEINNDIQQIYSDLKEQFGKQDNSESVFKYVKWFAGENKNLSYKEINADSVMITSAATSGYSNAKSTLFEFNSSGSGDGRERAQVLTIALTAMKDAANHGGTRLIVTRTPASLSKEDFKADNIVSLCHGNETAIYSGGAATAEYTYTKKLTKKAPDGTKAFRLTISGLEGGSSGDRERTHPNPSEEIASFINDCQSSRITVEIAAFSGGTSYDTYQKKATAVVVVPGSDAEKFRQKADKETDRYTDKNIAKESDLSFSVSEINLPSQVYSNESTTSVLSLLYTMNNGVFRTIDGENSGDSIAVSELGYLNMTGSTFTAKVSARVIDADVRKDMDSEFKATASLNDMSFKIDRRTPLWPYDTDSAIADDMSQAASEYGFKLETGFTYEQTDVAVMYAKNRNINAVLFSTNMKNGYEAVRTLMLYLRNMNR